MTASELVILNLGPGDFENGFPFVTARWGKPGGLGMQFTGSLPPAPELPQLYRNWQLLYEALCRSQSRSQSRSPIEIASVGITHVSEAAFTEIDRDLERQIQNWLGSAEFAPIERQLRTQLNPSQPIRLAIETDNETVWRLPLHLWSFLKDEYRLGEIVLSSAQYCAPPPKRREGGPVKILAILGNSVGINVRQDRALLARLPDAEVKLLVEPQRHELNDRLWEAGWDILFFAGHSTSDGDRGKLYINQNPDRNSVTVEELKEALYRATQKGLQLAIFNSCDGLGLARDLASAKIPLPTTIVMREPIADRVAQSFLKYFLRGFAFGEPFHVAVRQAREQLRGLEDEFPGASWLPVICQHPAIDPPTWRLLSAGDGDLSENAVRAVLPRRRQWQIAATIALACVGGYFALGPQMARWSNQLGMMYHGDGEFFTARSLYRTAAGLNLKFAAPYYNLGLLCDEMGDRQCAIEAHQKAALRGYSSAYAEASRLQILDRDYYGAMGAIRQCLARTEYDGVRAACRKNLGWLRLVQERYEEAETELRQAIALEVESPHSHCLLARVFEARGDDRQARQSWLQALKYTSDAIPEQDECIGMARQSLESDGDR
ncbi:MAG: CHAT domain-containing protein [Cyanobacteriota bacterium]|nr:CHAT domain-containing protein [Cyanobacteriota bacterium]